MEERGWSVTLVSQEPNSSVSSASLFSVQCPHSLLHICLTSSNDTFCVNPHQYRCSFPHYCENDFDSLICSNARLHVLQRRSYLLLYKYRFTINKYGHKVLQIPLEISAFISEHSGWFRSMIKFEMHTCRYMRNCIYGCSLPRVECSE